LSSQPQPVYPAEEIQPETAAAEPAAPQPETTPAEPSAPVTAEQPGEAKPPEEKKPPVVFKSVDYQDKGSESGKVALSGTGEPGARVFLYFDETPLGEVVVASDGTWAFEIEKKLETGEHKFRADRIEEGTGTVIGSASIGIMRMEPAKPPKEERVATPAPAAPAPEAATPPPESAPQVAEAEQAKPAASAEKRAQRKRHRPKVYTVRRGDTLWEIAESYYGGGWRYRAIVRDNRRKIRNPHWIYPKQKLHIPSGR
jgi:nucleoid-associated protein YgaU